MPPLAHDEDDAMTPLVSSGTRRGEHGGVTTNRILSIAGLVGVAAIFIYFQLQVLKLGAELDEERHDIKDLNLIISNQAQVIRRFNDSVTNDDVMKHLKVLETELNTTEKDLRHELKRTEDSIGNRLQETLTTLDTTVTQAKEEIHHEVNKVKEDVDQYVRTTQDQFSMENDFMIYQLAGTFTLLSGLISMWHMTAHLRRFNQPFVQRKILAILWMCPIYAITSWLSLVFTQAEGYLSIVKDFYEAYIIYQFLSFCIAVLGRGDREVVVDLLAENADHLTPPFRCCWCCNPDPYENDRELADAVLSQCQLFAMQFVFLKPLTAIALFVLEKLDYYGAGTSATDYRSPQFYIIMIQNLSVFIAFAGLLKFYHAVDTELAWCRPFAKFLCIKGVVFMTFWQGLAISILASATDVAGDDAQTWARSSQNFLICLEMLLFSIAHFYCFPVEEWEDGYKAAHSGGKFGDSIALHDFLQDLKLLARSNKKKRRKSRSSQSEILEVIKDDDDEDDDDEETQTGASLFSESTVDGDEKVNGLDTDARKAASRLINSLAFSFVDDDEKVEEGVGEDIRETDVEQGILEEDLYLEEETSSPTERFISDLSDNVVVRSEEERPAESTTGDRGEIKTANQGGDEEITKPPDETTCLLAAAGNQREHEETTKPPDETTSLLGGASQKENSFRTPNDEMLRPSIFTTFKS